jgi:hypothetical protein
MGILLTRGAAIGSTGHRPRKEVAFNRSKTGAAQYQRDQPFITTVFPRDDTPIAL